MATVAVAEFPVHDPEDPLALPVTLPVTLPLNCVAVTIPVTTAPDGAPIAPPFYSLYCQRITVTSYLLF